MVINQDIEKRLMPLFQSMTESHLQPYVSELLHTAESLLTGSLTKTTSIALNAQLALVDQTKILTRPKTLGVFLQ